MNLFVLESPPKHHTTWMYCWASSPWADVVKSYGNCLLAMKWTNCKMIAPSSNFTSWNCSHAWLCTLEAHISFCLVLFVACEIFPKAESASFKWEVEYIRYNLNTSRPRLSYVRWAFVVNNLISDMWTFFWFSISGKKISFNSGMLSAKMILTTLFW